MPGTRGVRGPCGSAVSFRARRARRPHVVRYHRQRRCGQDAQEQHGLRSAAQRDAHAHNAVHRALCRARRHDGALHPERRHAHGERRRRERDGGCWRGHSRRSRLDACRHRRRHAECNRRKRGERRKRRRLAQERQLGRQRRRRFVPCRHHWRWSRRRWRRRSVAGHRRHRRKRRKRRKRRRRVPHEN